MVHNGLTRLPTRSSAPYLLILRVSVLVHAALLVFEFATAGRIVAGDFGALQLHSTGAIVMHVAAGVQFGSAALFRRPGHGPLLPVVLSALTFALGFLQAYLGSHRVLELHVPAGMVLVALVVWVLVWTWTPAARRAAG